MIEDGTRLTLSLSSNSFFITDTLTGKSIIFKDGNCSAFTLDKETVLKKIMTLQEALNTYTVKSVLPFQKLPILGYADKLIIREDSHFSWTIGVGGKAAQLHDNTYYKMHGFDEDLVLRRLNGVYSQILNLDIARDPKRDIVRRISDVGLLVWVYGKHSVAVYEKNVSGCCMSNCLIDGFYHEAVLVGTSVSHNRAVLLTPDLEEIVTFPLDNSILAYYPDGDKIYSTQE